MKRDASAHKLCARPPPRSWGRLSDAFAQHVKDVNKDIPRISEEIITRLADLDDKAAANARALSELKGTLNAMMMARAR